MNNALLTTTVAAVHRDAEHRFSKQRVPFIELESGMGVVGDAHWGRTVKHRSRVRADPGQPNLRQVHLISDSLLAHLQDLDFDIAPGELGENITLAATDGLDWRELIALPVGAQLQFGNGPLLQLTGLRNPCSQIEAHQRGLLAAMVGRDDMGRVLRKAGVMSIVVTGGTVADGDPVTVHLPPPPHQPMAIV
ncbi:MAG: MOSC domain-containing protein [Acidovorax sp.]|nr:MOSC domain-containing protein [Acidovorax sp.]